jgi:hypothetical protein
MTGAMRARMGRVRAARTRLQQAQAEVIKFAAALNEVIRAVMLVQNIYPDEELLGEIHDMHHWLAGNLQLNIFGNLTDFVHVDLSQINLIPTQVNHNGQADNL